MTKLEELTALLVNELHQFNKNIEKLESICQQLNDLKFKVDISEYKYIIEEQQKQMTIHKDALERFEGRFNAKIGQAKIYPTWVVVVVVFIFYNVVIIVLFSYLFQK